MKQKKNVLKVIAVMIFITATIVCFSQMARSPNVIETVKTNIAQRIDEVEESMTDVALSIQNAISEVKTLVRDATADFTLTSSVNTEAANGKGGVDLDWSTYTESNKTFKVYQKKEGTTEYETISALNFNLDDMEPTNVLNVYPYTTSIPTVTFKYSDGTTKELPKSAALKVWMEGGTMTQDGVITTFEPYGINPTTGQQLIYVTSVASDVFNNDPSIIWDYDIVMFGTWDGNGYKNECQPNDAAIEVIEQYIKAGYGILAGHDTIGYKFNGIGLSKLRSYFNIEVGYFGDFSTITTPVSDIDVQSNWRYDSIYVSVKKNGTITNFPWELSEEAKLTIPKTHTCANAANGTVWLELVDGSIATAEGTTEDYFNTGTGNPYYYVTTYNNTAMIQTGHSMCESTEDERKVLANTLFYLNQLSSSTSTTDNSAQDLKEPNAPVANVEGVNGDGKISVKYNAKDNGNTYNYYVEAYDKSDSSTVVATSNEVTEVVTTGTKGYYYIIDGNVTNDFDISTATYTESEQLLLDYTNQGKYLHVKAVDYAGNVSALTDLQINVDLEYFTLTVKDGNNNEIALPNSKFIITEIVMVDGVETEEEAKDIFLNPVGTSEEIDGKTVRTIETDENGKVQINLKTGYYKIKQIETYEGYEIGENNEIHYFGINSNRGENVELIVNDPFNVGDAITGTSVSPTAFQVEGRSDGSAIYYHLDYISLVSPENKIVWTKESEKVYEIFADDDGFDVLQDSKILRYDNNGNIVKEISLTDGMRAWTRDENGNTIIIGEFSDTKTISADSMASGTETSITSNGETDVFIMVIDSDNKVVKINNIGTEAAETVKNVEVMKNGNYAVTYIEDSSYKLMTIDSESLTVNKDVSVNTTGRTSTTIHDIAINEDGSIYYVGSFNGTITFSEEETLSGEEINLTSVKEDGILVKYTSDLKVEWARSLGGSNTDHFFNLDTSDDNGIVIGGDSNGGGLVFAAEDTQAGYAITTEPVGSGTVENAWMGITVKINSEGKIVWAREFGFSANEGCYAVTSFTNDTFALCGFSNTVSGANGGKAMFIRVSEQTIDVEIEAMTELDVYNYKKQYNITTETVNEGGTISTSEDDVYEIVEYDGTSTKEITITSNSGYRIKSIVIEKTDEEGNASEEEVELEEDTRTYTLSSFTNVKENINVVAEFERIESKVIVHHYFENTTTSIVDDNNKEIVDEEISGYVNDEYTTTESDKAAEYYELVNVPDNQNGIFTEETIEIIYYYKYKEFEYTVKYYYEDIENEEEEEKYSATYNTLIEEFEDKTVKGYEFSKTDGLPLTISTDSEKNIIKVYYIKRTDITYTVEYYYDNVLDETKTETFENQKYEDLIEEYPDKILTGYKYETDTAPIILDIENNVIKVYYITDESQTKEISYTVEYYKDSIKEDDDTQTVSKTVQVLSPDTIEVNKDEINITDKYYGYKISEIIINDETVEELPDNVTTEDVIKIYYITDESQTKELSYTVEYYKEDIKEEDDTQTVKATVQVLKSDMLSVNKDEINITDKYYGYKLSKITVNDETVKTLPDEIETGEIIKIYYIIDESQTKKLNYTVEYYKDNGEKETEEKEITVQVLQPDTLTVDKDNINIVDEYYGYKLSEIIVNDETAEEIPDTVETGTTIKVYYVIDENQTKNLNYTVEYYKDNVKVESDTQKVETTVQVLQPDTLVVNKGEINITDKYVGYVLDSEKTEELQDEVTTGTVIKIYYKIRTDIIYTVEYYYDNVKDDSKTEVIENQTYGALIEEYTDKILTGYKYETDTAPITLDIEDNIIKVYYVTDESQTKELEYTFEYYKENKKVDSQIRETTVQVLQPDTLEVNKEEINIVDEYYGYKLSEITVNDETVEEIPEEVETGTIIKIYYVIDESQTKEISYNIEYYKEGKLEETEKISKTVQVLEEEILEVDKTKLTDIYKYLGYKLVNTEPIEIPEEVENGEVLKAYYLIDEDQTKELSYTVEYYKNGVKADTDEVKQKVQILKPDTITVDKTKINLVDKYIGYKLGNTDPEEIPDEIETGEVIKIYYVIDESQTKELSYTVEYYKDNVKVESDTQIVTKTVQVLDTDTIEVNKDEINVDDKYVGYILDKTEPTEIPETINSGETIKIYYKVRTDITYTVEYYYDNKKDESKTEVIENQTYGALIETYTDKNIAGYKYETDTAPIVLDVENNVIQVYYIKDIFEYKVEYYYEGTKDSSKTEIKTATYKDLIEEYPDKNIEGYKLSKTEKFPLTVSENASNNIISVYYIIDDGNTKELTYTVEYYKDNVIVEEDTQIVKNTVQILEANTLKVDKTQINVEDKYVGYKLEKTEPETIPGTVNTGETIKVYYVKDEFNYTVEYYYDGVINKNLTESGKVEYETTIDVYTDKNITGYKLEKTESYPLKVTEDESQNIIKVYYVKDKFNYTVEYYYEGVIDTSKTEKIEATYKDEIATYTDNNKYGYKLEKTENYPLTVSEDENKNIIKVYYAINESQTKEISYTVEYYKDEVKAEEDTQEVKTTVQVLKPDSLVVDKTQINTVNKYLGYKLDSTEPETIPSTINDGEIIKVYYVLDESQTKELTYTVEYYKDNVKVEEDTQEVKETVQVLKPDTLTVDKTQINVDDKYVGYKLEKTEPTEIPTEVTTGSVLKVYYIPRTDITYTVEYYYDNEKDESKTEVIENQTYGALIETYIDKNIVGYKWETDTAPIVLDVENNVIKVYYVKDEFNYTVEYYYEGLKDTSKTEVLKGKYKEVITEYPNKALTGYMVEKTEGIPLTITEKAENNIIKVYYVKGDYEYTVEYYYDGIRDASKTEIIGAKYGEIITTYTEKSKIGYVVESVDNLPLTIKEVSMDNIIRVYYIKGEFNYTVEYYYEGIKDETKTVTSKAKYESLVEDYEEKNITGYKLKEVENIPLVITEKAEENIIKVYYEKQEYEYKVEYYYDGEKHEVETEYEKAKYKEEIKEYQDKNITGYKLEKTENLPLTITELSDANVIRIYYVKADYSYTVNYYYDDVINKEKTETLYGTYEEIIETYPDKSEYGYEFKKVEGLPLTITEKAEENIINVYYGRKTGKVEIKYVDKISGREISVETTKTGKVLDSFDITEDVKEIEGYTLIEKPESMTGKYKEESQTFTYYYAVTSDVIVKYLEKGTEEELAEEEQIIGYEGKKYTTSKKDIEGYTYVESTKNTEGTMTKRTTEVTYYYLQNTTVRVEYKDRETGVILEKVIAEGKVGDIYESKAKDFENYILVEEPIEKTVTMEKEEIVIEYYYAHVSEGVIEKHIDVMTGEILDNETYLGNEGDEYETTSKKFKGYDLVEERIPTNAEGTMTIGTIEVRYYYIRQTKVIVEYVDVKTGENLEENGEDTTEIIEGHEGDSYTAKEKVISEYEIVKEKYPTNSTGRMTVTLEEDGDVNTVTRVTFYYVHKSKGVEEQYIDVTTGELIGTNIIKGNEGDEYTSTPKEIEGYELVIEKEPTNTEGEMTVEKIEVKYYYIRKIKVIVEYIDTNTTLKLKEINPNTQSEEDSTEVIEGLEGDSYKTEEKEFANYKLVSKTENTEGIMKAEENGSKTSEIKVKYYYAKVSPGIIEKYIDATTGEIITEQSQEGYEGDAYTSKPKEIEGYDIVEEKLPANREGTMGEEQTEIKYYYVKKTKVIIEYINRKTGNKIQADKVIEGHEGDVYSAVSIAISGYNLVDKTNNETGTMTKSDIIVKYYYENPNEVVNSNGNKVGTGKTPNTGDMLPIYAISMIIIVVILNVMMQVIIIKKKEN